MLKHLLVGTLALSSLALAQPPAHQAVPLPPPPRAQPAPQMNGRFDHDRFDARNLNRLVSAFDDATARRDMRAIANIDRQIGVYLQQEVREARGDRRMINRLNRIEDGVQRLLGRFDRRSIDSRRALYGELMRISDGRDGRAGRRF